MSSFRNKAINNATAVSRSLRPRARPTGLGSPPPVDAEAARSSTSSSSVSPVEREVLARTIEAEAGGEGEDGMLAVGANIANRVASGRWGNTFTEAILAPGQYSAWNGRNPTFGDDRAYNGGSGALDMENMKVSDRAYRVTDTILSGNYDDPTNGATHYYNPRVANPPWGQAKGGGDWVRIGNHLFGVPKGERRVSPSAVSELKTRLASASGTGGGSMQSASEPTRPQERPAGLGDALAGMRPQARPDRGPETSLRPPPRPSGYQGVEPQARPDNYLGTRPQERPDRGPREALLPQERPQGEYPWQALEPVARPRGLAEALLAGTPGFAYDPATGRIFER